MRGDGAVRTVHMTGEPVLDGDGCTASMWAVLRDVSELRRSERAVRESRESLHRRREAERAEHRAAADVHDAVLPSWHGPLRLAGGGPAALDVAGHHLPSRTGERHGSGWYDALELPDGDALLTAGDLPGQGAGGLRDGDAAGRTARAGGRRVPPRSAPGPSERPHRLRGAARPGRRCLLPLRARATRTLRWAAGRPPRPAAVPRRARARAAAARRRPAGRDRVRWRLRRAEVRLAPGDVLLLHTGGPDADAPVERGCSGWGSGSPGRVTRRTACARWWRNSRRPCGGRRRVCGGRQGGRPARIGVRRGRGGDGAAAGCVGRACGCRGLGAGRPPSGGMRVRGDGRTGRWDGPPAATPASCRASSPAPSAWRRGSRRAGRRSSCSSRSGGEPVHLAQPVPGALRRVRAHRVQREPGVAVRLLGVVRDEAGRRHGQVVEDLERSRPSTRRSRAFCA